MTLAISLALPDVHVAGQLVVIPPASGDTLIQGDGSTFVQGDGTEFTQGS